jgi:hypothetical protein
MKEFAPENLHIAHDGSLSLNEDQRNRWGLIIGSKVVIRLQPELPHLHAPLMDRAHRVHVDGDVQFA